MLLPPAFGFHIPSEHPTPELAMGFCTIDLYRGTSWSFSVPNHQ
jgi:hypothetical protein